MRALAVLLLGVLTAGPLGAQEWKQLLAKDLVTVQGGKMVFEEFDLVKLEVPGYQPAQFQLKVHAEAPVGGLISRDNFVALTSSLTVVTFFAVYAQGYQVHAADFIQAVDFTELAAPIGTPDLELNLFMTDEGLQFEWVNTADGQRSRWTSTWAEAYGK